MKKRSNVYMMEDLLQQLQYYTRNMFSENDFMIFLIVLATVTLLPVFLCALRYKPLVRTVALTVFVIYILGNLSFTILGRHEITSYGLTKPVFENYHQAFYLDLGLEGTIQHLMDNGIRETLPYIHINSYVAAREVLLNVLLYMPMGYLLPFVFKPMRYSVAACTLVGFICSCATEYAQYVWHIGYCQVDDVINNTLGCFAGAVMGCMLARIWNTK